MLILRDAQDRVLLQRRGANGVWSGLWSLPEAKDTDLASSIAHDLAELGTATAEILPPFLHTFTHYRLYAQPLQWRNVYAHQGVADTQDMRWCARAHFAQLGIPAPVRKLLVALR